MTEQEWIDLVEKTLPKVTDYAIDNRTNWDAANVNLFFVKKDYTQVWKAFSNLWEELPDNSGIRHGPFFDICDICSEYRSW